MNKLICAEPGRFEYQESDIPSPKSGESLIKIRKVGVCGTDLHAFEGTQPYFSYPRVLGHELAADFVRGDAVGFEEGEALTIIPYFTKGLDIASRMGKPNCSVDMQVCGVHIDGGMAEYLVVPSVSLVKGEGLTHDELALIEPLAIGAHGIRRAQVIPNEFALVIGAGPIGLGIMEFARIAGARVIAMDVDQQRLDFAAQLGVSHLVHASAEDVEKQLLDITNGEMPTLLIDATGNTNAINNAFKYMAHGARYVLVGLQKNNISFSHPAFHKREGTLMSSRNALRADFEYVIQCLKNRQIDPNKYITKRIPFEEVKKQFSSLLQSAGNIKTIIEMNN